MLTDPFHTERIYTLWDELADLGAAGTEEARRHLLSTVADMVQARQADWIGAVRLNQNRRHDPMFGWRPRSVFALHPDPDIARVIQNAFSRMEQGEPDITTVRNAQQAGQFRAFLLSELATPDWFESEGYKAHYLAIDRQDSIWVGIPVNADFEIQIGFHRGLDQPPFEARDKAIVSHALRGIRWFYRQQMLAEGVGMASEPLTPTESQVLQGLLRGVSERKIAEENGQSPHTTHDHVKRIYRKYGVTSRSALMALWLGRQDPPDQGIQI